MLTHEFVFKVGGKAIKTRAFMEEKHIFLSFPYCIPLLDQVKAMKGAEWVPHLEQWKIDNCQRNWFAFDILTRGPRSARYFKDPDVYAPQFVKPDTSFMSHQAEMYNFELSRRRCLLGSEPRTGKTLPTLQCFYDSPFDFAYWVTTCSAMPSSFREMRKWFNANLKYKKSDLFYQLSPNKTIMLCSYDYLVNNIGHLGTPPGFVIFDECHKLKDYSSARSKAANELSLAMEDYYKDEEFVIGLSGTPEPLAPTDWWSQCEIIRRGFVREGSVPQFKGRYGDYKPYDGSTPVWERFEGFSKEKVAQLSGRLKGLVRVYLFKDVMKDIPPTRFERVRLRAPKSLLRVAKLITETSVSALETRRRLRQLSDGFEYTKEYDADKNEYVRSGSTFLGSAKIEQLKADIEEYEEIGRMVVYAAFTASIDICRNTYLEAGWHVLQLTSDKALYTPDGIRLGGDESLQLALDQMDRSSNDYKIRKLAVVADTGSGGSGLEFSASPVIIYYSNSDLGEGRMQSEFRGKSVNMDKERGLTIKDYILLSTDEKILDQQEAKKEMQAISMGDLASIINQQFNETDSEEPIC